MSNGLLGAALPQNGDRGEIMRFSWLNSLAKGTVAVVNKVMGTSGKQGWTVGLPDGGNRAFPSLRRWIADSPALGTMLRPPASLSA
jgi:hypothetical protein